MTVDEDGDGDASASPVEISAVCKRKLIHWVNSLPLASCLLVDELVALRFGDVLWAIVTWLETGDVDASSDQETPSSRVMVTRAVQYVAQRCCAKDRDVMYVIHGAQCVARVLKGDAEAIAAVLLVLKRLTEEAQGRKRTEDVVGSEARRRELTLEITRHCTSRRTLRRTAKNTQNSGLDQQTRQAQDAAAATPLGTGRRPSQTRRGPTLVGNVGRSPLRHDRGGENRAVSSIAASSPAPTRRKYDQTRHTTENASIDRSRVLLERLRQLGVKIPTTSSSTSQPAELNSSPTSIHSLLKDGVALCVLAAALVRRRGSMSVRHKLHTVRSSEGSANERGVLFVRGAMLEPRTQAEKRHNLVVAWELLNECRMLDSSPTASINDADTLIRVVCEGGAHGEGLLQRFLEGVMSQFDRTAVRDAETVSKADATATTSHVNMTIGKRPYITAEQIDVIKKWMKASGVDPNAISSGILEDSLRNGVALCQLINQTRARNEAKIVFKNLPRTLVDVRENIQKGVSALTGKLPLVYATSHAVEGIIMGDKQYIFGILWVFMQLCKDDEVRLQQRPSTSFVNNSSLPPPPPPPRPPPEVQAAVPKPIPPPVEPLRRELRPASRPLSGFELDVLASDLVEEESRIPSAPFVWSTTAVPWDEAEMHDDIVPFAVLREVPSPQASYDADITPQKRAPPRVPYDIISDRVSVDDNEPQQKPSEPSPDQNDKEMRAVDAIVDAAPTSPVCSPVSLKPSPPTPSFSTSQIDHVIQWLRSLGINLRNPHDLHTPGAVLTEFQSGVLLCEIVEKLEHMRSMEGVCRQDNLARAQALHNIDKALVVLQSKKVIPLHAIRNKWKIAAGDQVAVLDLLIHTRKAYASRTSRKMQSEKSAKANQP